MEKHKFRIGIPEDRLDDLSSRLKARRLPGDFANNDWRMGVERKYLEEITDYWLADYNWRSVEREMNGFHNFRVDLSGVPVHFILEKGVGPAPLPIVLSHGWPWTFWDFQKLIRPLADPAACGADPADAFDVVVPSLPGFGFSTPLRQTGINFSSTARLWVKLMTEVLGYERFFAHGGDLGNLITGELGHRYADVVGGIHLTGAIPLGVFSEMNSTALPDWGFKAPATLPANPHLHAPGVIRSRPQSPHMQLHIHEPQTIAYALNDSPVGMLAWLLQRRRWWSHNDGNVEDSFSKDFLITNAMIYWLTESYASAARYYAEMVDHPWEPAHQLNPVVQSPTAITFFDHDGTSQSRFWVEDYYNLHYVNSFDSGGHFAPAEQPDLLVEDIRHAFRPLRNS